MEKLEFNFRQTGNLTIGGINLKYGTGCNQWSSNTADLIMEFAHCADYTEISIHDANTRVASFMYSDGVLINFILVEIKVGVKLKQKYQEPSQCHVIVGFYQVMH